MYWTKDTNDNGSFDWPFVRFLAPQAKVAPVTDSECSETFPMSAPFILKDLYSERKMTKIMYVCKAPKRYSAAA